ncbi:hypothetical protein EDB81DRAFT_914141 [Dactylonectria macrodidyma]|uniref:Uncharacterized protein n=1 Tax=Dactylonectria macrodidyma TaxID=307937 RepID=A0A9P9DJ97_9HYPO|nr:hypothetical protein EDB81DRAFT_914141 [Dactylonectria macrodidyma]
MALETRRHVHTADNLLETIRQGDLGGFRDSNDLIKHIIFEAISFPNEFKWAGLGEHVLDIFEAEIASAVDKEAKFFWEFTDPKSNPRDMNLTIERAAKSTWLVKDIRDELRLLRQLFENQLKLAQEVSETFWPTLMSGETRSSKEARKSIRESFIGESGVETLIQRVKQMDEDASTTLDGLSNIIQAMQAQASLKEAEAARFMNAIILPFTVMTVIFTPLSFLTSLFAVNTSGFPHNGDGELSLSTKWFSLRMVFGELTSLVATFLLVWLAYTWQHKPKADKKPKTDARLSNMKGKR